MRIDNLSPILARSLLAALPKTVPGFPVSGEEPPAPLQPPLATPGAMPPTSVQTLVAIAIANPVIERRRRLARNAEKGIDALDRLHKELVAGTPNVSRLREIIEWAETVPTPEDPTLASLMQEIDLRVRVELAKLDIQV